LPKKLQAQTVRTEKLHQTGSCEKAACKMLVKSTLWVNFINPLVQSRNLQAHLVDAILFHQQNFTSTLN